MKEIGLDTVGGRIRKVRQDAKQSMQAFADGLGVTSNYIGLMERGERNPSPDLLQRIAATTGVPYDWLVHGDPPQGQKEAAPKDDDVAGDPAQAVNPQLFLSLVLARSPALSRDMMATMLSVPPEAMDAILGGMPVDYDPRWGKAFSVMAQTLDLDALRQDLRNLDVFLAQEQAVKKNAALLRALRSHVAKSGDFKVVGINDQRPDVAPTHIPYTDIVMYGGGSKPLTWYFKCLEPVDVFSPSDIIGNMGRLGDRCSIVLTSEDAYRSLCDFCSGFELEFNGASSHALRNDSIIYYDCGTGRIEEWQFSKNISSGVSETPKG